MFYLGEFGPSDLNYTNNKTMEYVYKVINLMTNNNESEIKNPWFVSTIWAWEDCTHGNTLINPNSNNDIDFITFMKHANLKLKRYV